MNRILKTISDQRKGELVTELQEEFTKLVKAVIETGKAGSISLKLTVTPSSKARSETIILLDEIKSKIPEMAKPTSMFFVDDEGMLSRQDPRQKEFEPIVKPAQAPAAQPVAQTAS